jgi:ketosteroid isomerase-like protein
MAIDLAGLDARLKKLEDIEAIRELRMQYHYCINESMFDRTADVFTEDAYVDFEQVATAKGREAIRDLLIRLAQSLTIVKQFIHNHMVTVDGDTASGISYLDARYAQDGKSIIAAVKFAEKYRRIPAGWKISEMVVKIYFTVPITEGWASDKLLHIKPVPQKARA